MLSFNAIIMRLGNIIFINVYPPKIFLYIFKAQETRIITVLQLFILIYDSFTYLFFPIYLLQFFIWFLCRVFSNKFYIFTI